MNKRFAVVVICLSIGIALPVFANDPTNPEDLLRSATVTTNAFMFPSALNPLSTPSSLSWYDNYSMAINFLNLIPRGNNLSISTYVNHGIAPVQITPRSGNGDQITSTIGSDIIGANVRFTFLQLLTIIPAIEYSQSKVYSINPEVQDYSYDAIQAGLTLSWESRYSSWENWYLGQVPVYGNRGYEASISYYFKNCFENNTGQSISTHILGADIQGYIPLDDYFTVALGGNGSFSLTEVPQRVIRQHLSMVASPGYDGDFAANAVAELRFLHPVSLSITTPAFLIAPQDFRFSPGFLVGYNLAICGSYNQSSPLVVQSIYIAPLIAIRLNATLLIVFRVDCGFNFTSDGIAKFVLDFGTVGSQPKLIAMGGL